MKATETPIINPFEHLKGQQYQQYYHHLIRFLLKEGWYDKIVKDLTMGKIKLFAFGDLKSLIAIGNYDTALFTIAEINSRWYKEWFRINKIKQLW